MKRRSLRLVKVVATCSRGHEVEIEISAREYELHRDSDPSAPIVRVECPFLRCGHRVWLTAGAIQRAA